MIDKKFSDAVKVPNKSSRVVFLDWLRIFAFSSVLIGHLFYANLVAIANDESLHVTLRLIVQWLLPFFLGGGAGVVVFFLVSGYIITHVLQTEKPLEFLIRRIFRIYPLFIFAVLFQYCLIVFVSHGQIDFKTLIVWLLLVGDFFNAPLALNGVEWTLRIEVLFYAFMFLAACSQLFSKYKSAFPWVSLVVVLIIGMLPAFGQIPGYFNIYAPFLFLGTLFWLYENNYVSLSFMVLFICIVFFQYWYLIDTLEPGWRGTHFCALAFILFSTAWVFRAKFTFSKITLFISELTYAVYLLHDWLFAYTNQFLAPLKLPYSNLCSLVILFLVSTILVRLIEKPGIKVGRQLIKKLKKYKKRTDTHVLSDSTLNQVKNESHAL